MSDPTLERIARRVKWREQADATLAHRDDFLCRVIALGTWDDAVYVEGRFVSAVGPSSALSPRP